MRSAVLIVVPLALLAAVFYFFILSNRPATPVDAIATAATQPTTRKFVPSTTPSEAQASVIGQSGNVWVRSLNRKTGRLASMFRAAQFNPRPDGAVDVVTPQARFYGENGGVVTLDGTRGKVSLSQPGERSDAQSLGAATPTEGELQDVVVRFYEKSVDDEPVGEPTITTMVPAVHFDAIGNRISTIDSVIDGKGVMAEQVPVTVRGRDFELDGQGLTLRWNDREGRLDNLEINKGKRLLVKNLASFGQPKPAAAPAAPTPAEPTPAASIMFPFWSPEALLMGQVAVDAAAPATKPAAPKQRELYHATFDKDVHVWRDGQELAAGDVMRVVLPLGEAREPRVEAPTPAEEARAKRAKKRAAMAATEPATEAAVESTPRETRPAEPRAAEARTPATQRPSTRASFAPATAPSGPIEVRWSGKLIVRPAALVEDAPKEQMVEIVGAPAWVAENGSRADARLIHIEPDSGRLRLEPGGPVKAIQVHDAKGADLRSRSPLLVDRSIGKAEINGGGTLITPAVNGGQATTVSWSKRMALGLGDTAQASLRNITIEGDANVASEQLKLACDTLALGFDAPAESSTPSTAPANVAMPAADLSLLRTVEATGSATMDVGTGDTRRMLAGEKIQLGMVAGDKQSAALESVKAQGHVKMDDAKGFALTSGTLDVTTKPMLLNQVTPATQPAGTVATTAGSVQDPLDNVTHFVATDDVHLKQADGSSAAGDRVELVTLADGKRMTLLGKPANVASAKGSLQGEQIHLNPTTGDVDVPGPGKFASLDTKQPGNTMSLAWLDSMKANGTTGLCTLNGGIDIDGNNGDGTHLHATAKRGIIQFGTKASSTTPSQASTRPAMSNVTLDSIRTVHLIDDVDIASETLDIRTSSVQTQLLDIDLENGIVSAPQAGRMLMIDRRPTTQPATAATTRPMPKDKFGPGSLALGWQDKMLWKMREGVMTFDGGIRFGFEKAGSNDPLRMTCEQLICTLAPIEPGKDLGGTSQRIEMRSVTASRNVTVRSRLASFDAATMNYDAQTNRATAAGDANTPVEVFDSDATSRVGFSAITWNLDTGLIEDFRDISGHLRR